MNHVDEELNDNDKADVNEAMERNGMQMIEVLMTRLNNLSSKVIERKKACVQDRNPNSDFCSSLVQGLQQELSDDENEDRETAINSNKEKKVSIFRPRISSREYNIPGRKASSPPPGTLAVGEVYVTFRGEPSTDFGKRLEHKFDLDNGIDNSNHNSKNGNGLSVTVGGDHKRRPSRVGHRQRAGQKKLDDTKALRLKYEKKLLDNLEAFVSRSVTDLVYTMPSGASAKMGGNGPTSPFKPPPGLTLPKTTLNNGNNNGNNGEGSSAKESRHDAILRASSPSNLSRQSTPGMNTGGSRKQRRSTNKSAAGSDSSGNTNNNTPKLSVKSLFAPAEGGDGNAGENVEGGGGGGGRNPNRASRRASTLPYEGGIVTDLRSPQLHQNASSFGNGIGLGDEFTDSQLLDAEEFPIPLSKAELNPGLLLGLACTKVSLSAGDSLMSKFSKSSLSSWLFVYMFWFIHCKSFQSDTLLEQEHLLRKASSIYVQLISSSTSTSSPSTVNINRHKDFIFKHYPYILANSIIGGFHYLCPGSRHLYTHAWKRIVYLQCCQILSGLPDICPISVLVHRNQLFHDDAVEEQAFMAKEYNRAAVVAAATGVPLAKNAGMVDDVLPPLPGQGTNKEKKKKTENNPEGNDSHANRQEGNGNNEEIMPSSKLLSSHSEYNMNDNNEPLSPKGGIEGSFTESMFGDDMMHQLKVNNSSKHTMEPGSPTRRTKYPSNKRNKKKKQHIVCGESGHDGDGESLVASRIMHTGGGSGASLDGSGGEDYDHHLDHEMTDHNGGYQHDHEKDEEYWKERRTQSLQPLIELTGNRKSLRFNPQVPEEFKVITEGVSSTQGPHGMGLTGMEGLGIEGDKTRSEPLARQRKVKFDQSGVSPLVQQYLEHPQPFIKGGRKPEKMGRTAPVKWCMTGPSDTFTPSQSRKAIHEEIAAQHKAAIEVFRSQEKAQRKLLRENLRNLETQRKAVYRGGSVSVGKYSLQLVAEISGRSNEGARKRDEKAKEKERERLASEKERQKKAIEDQALSKA